MPVKQSLLQCWLHCSTLFFLDHPVVGGWGASGACREAVSDTQVCCSADWGLYLPCCLMFHAYSRMWQSIAMCTACHTAAHWTPIKDVYVYTTTDLHSQANLFLAAVTVLLAVYWSEFRAVKPNCNWQWLYSSVSCWYILTVFFTNTGKYWFSGLTHWPVTRPGDPVPSLGDLVWARDSLVTRTSHTAAALTS